MFGHGTSSTLAGEQMTSKMRTAAAAWLLACATVESFAPSGAPPRRRPRAVVVPRLAAEEWSPNADFQVDGGVPDPEQDDGSAERLASSEEEMWASFSPRQIAMKRAERAAAAALNVGNVEEAVAQCDHRAAPPRARTTVTRSAFAREVRTHPDNSPRRTRDRQVRDRARERRRRVAPARHRALLLGAVRRDGVEPGREHCLVGERH